MASSSNHKISEDSLNNQDEQTKEQDSTLWTKCCRRMSIIFFITVITIFIFTTAFFFLTVHAPMRKVENNSTTIIIAQEEETTTIRIELLEPQIRTGLSKADLRNLTLYTIIPKLTHCGMKSDIVSKRTRRKRIIGGEQVQDLNLYPWMAQIAAQKPDLTEIYYCSGTLVTKRYVLTSAHCVYNIPPTHVQLRGDKKLFEVTEVTIHPGFVKFREIVESSGFPPERSRFDDVALLRLSRDATFNHPICLPFKKFYELDKADFDTPEGFVTGYGFTSNNETQVSEFLHQVILPKVETAECQTFYDRPDIVTKKMFCAGGDYKDFCRGDSGAPFFITAKNKIFQIGIATFGGKICGEAPGVFTSTADYLTFILETVRE